MHSLFVGTSGYFYRHWHGIFYPKTLPREQWLAFYSRQFSTVEINATFYGRFTRETFVRWRQEVGDDFAFSLKGSRFLTHVKRLNEPEASIERFFAPARGLGQSLSCVLWQFPNTFLCKAETLSRLDAFLKLLPPGVRQAVEFRHPLWFTDSVFTLLDRHGAGFVINDSPHFPACERVTGDFAYIRFHGPGALYASSYATAELEAWARKIERFLRTYDVYCYFNNDSSGFAIENAKALRRLLES